MSINQAGLDLIKTFEGCKLRAYKDSVGVLTIGYGHTSRAGPPMVRSGLTITQREAEQILATDLKKYEAAVGNAIAGTINPNQYAAFVSLCYNIGPGAFAKSTAVRKFNLGDINGAAAAILKFNMAGGQVLNGLTRRRKAERMLFLTPTSARKPDVAPLPPLTPKPAPRPVSGPVAVIAIVLTALAGFIATAWEHIVAFFN